jgi:hypothetical protein
MPPRALRFTQFTQHEIETTSTTYMRLSVLVAKRWNQLIANFMDSMYVHQARSLGHLKIELLGFNTWSPHIFRLSLYTYVYCSLLFYNYSYFIRYLEIIQDWSYNPIFGLNYFFCFHYFLVIKIPFLFLWNMSHIWGVMLYTRVRMQELRQLASCTCWTTWIFL